MELTDIEIIRTNLYPQSPVARAFTRVTGRVVHWLKLLWHSGLRRAATKRRTLAVCESAPLGDRRFVSVIQFEHRRFLIASSPTSINLISQLSDDPASLAFTEPDKKRSESN
jgi:flagellar biogenesis protein FliO